MSSLGIALALFGVALIQALSAQEPAGSDPPATFLRGKVTKIDPKDPNRIEIDVGSDRELKSGHTLDVYRLAPRPSYVGMLRILKVNTCGSIGEMVASKSLTQNPVKVGDIVASSLNK